MRSPNTAFPMSYRVRVWDNFNYMDESEAYDEGTYATYAEALDAAKKVVRRSLEHAWLSGSTLDRLMTNYVLSGEDPGIICDGPAPDAHFSARDYAREIAPDVVRMKTLEDER